MNLPPLETCPVCDYSLTGLPDQHRCPECGFSYERRMQVLKQSPKMAWFYFLFAAWTCIMGATAVLSSRPLTFWQWFKLATWGIILLTMWRVVVGRRCKMVFWPGGLILTGREQSPELFSWSRIDHAVPATLWTHIKLRDAERKTITQIDDDFFGSKKRMDQFLELVQAWKERHEQARAHLAMESEHNPE